VHAVTGFELANGLVVRDAEFPARLLLLMLVRLLAGAFAVLAPRPAAGPTLALFKLLLSSADAAFSGHLLLGILDPTDELVAAQRRDVFPGSERRRVDDQRSAQVFRKFVHHPTGHSLAAHKTTLAGIVMIWGGAFMACVRENRLADPERSI
jgi:hypothetical protein